jgi:hypothetical protein
MKETTPNFEMLWSANTGSVQTFHPRALMVGVTSGSTAKRSPASTFHKPSPGFAALRDEARSGPISRQCQQTPG